ncbi:MAG TPA: C45 family autoproteolytic acyltransferase/hydrolase [Gemmatales bacterium]|nr:C45 family autoproteolytic acyltransferase/hydrolase [Gemmatales bacterium]HMP58099.1 C45 family autoproteolytic acyltransferase/hydrolase [Gemmatales bacterium]
MKREWKWNASWCVALASLLGLAALAAAWTEAPFRYADQTHGSARLSHMNGIPVMQIGGTPEEIGEQAARLAVLAAPKLATYPRELVNHFGGGGTWPVLLALSKQFLNNFPPDYRRELDALIAHCPGLDPDLIIAGNTLFDIKKYIACTSLMVERSRSATGRVLLGRNLDFPTLGYLQHYSLVTVVRPTGKRAFAAIGFPGMVGVLSGMNDAGLALVVHEVYASRDGASVLDFKGMPYALCFRKVLEECATVAEARALLEKLPRTTHLNLAIADPETAGVLEITAKNVIFRPAEEGFACCTNHFLSRELTLPQHHNIYLTVDRLEAVAARRQLDKLGVADLAGALHAANLGVHTLQTMVFEPETRTLWLAIGSTPSSALPLKRLDLAELLRPSETRPAASQPVERR